ncbi:MAG TPA: hypothetical protein VJ992_14485, partial [Gemmatimonadales bacterium]|nr:hypothetical protein [Gemmatimonadales bacterium]
ALTAVKRLDPDSFAIRAPRFDQLAGSDELRLALDSATAAATIAARWRAADAEFVRERVPYLLYH